MSVMVTSAEIRATSTAAPRPASGSRRGRRFAASRPKPADPAPRRPAPCGSSYLRPLRLREGIGDVEPRRQAVHPGRLLVGESLRRRRPPQRLAEQFMRLQQRAAISAARARRAQSSPMIHSPGRLSLLRGASQASGDGTSAFAISLRLPSVSTERLRQPLDQPRRRLVGHEMARQLGGDVLRRRRMTRKIGQHRAALLDAGCPDSFCRCTVCGARLVHARD